MVKTAPSEPQSLETFEIFRELEIKAPVAIAFEAILAQLGPESEMPGGKPFPMKLEAHPGGRWYRDLGDDAGHLWGHIQVIKPPTLLEICGPLMMSYPAMNHLQYRLKAEGGVTRLSFTHRAAGWLTPEHREGLGEGWTYWLNRMKELAEAKAGKEA